MSEPLFRLSETLLLNTQKLIANCPCASGCPSCVGPIGEVGEKGKEVALEILRTDSSPHNVAPYDVAAFRAIVWLSVVGCRSSVVSERRSSRTN